MEAGKSARVMAEAVARRGYGKLVAFLVKRTRDVAAAEDALADAFAAALVDWPANGIPDNPEAWLIAVARRKAIDDARRRGRNETLASMLLPLLGEDSREDSADAREIPDERLSLMFACAHPAIDANIRAPLILQTILGFDAAAIASAFLVAPATMGQRLARAKSRIRLAGIPFRKPDQSEMRERVDAVLEAIYATFTEGWTDPVGADARRRGLSDEAIWLGRLVAALLPDDAEALGLVALMLHAEARRAARRDARGAFRPLDEQDPGLWNAEMIAEAELFLRQAASLSMIGRYQLEAAIQSAHAARRRTGRSDWPAIVVLYDALHARTHSPVVAINRAVALLEALGAEAGLQALDAIDDARIADYQPFWAARAAILSRAGDRAGAASAYHRAIGLEADPSVRAFLLERWRALTEDPPVARALHD